MGMEGFEPTISGLKVRSFEPLSYIPVMSGRCSRFTRTSCSMFVGFPEWRRVESNHLAQGHLVYSQGEVPASCSDAVCFLFLSTPDP